MITTSDHLGLQGDHLHVADLGHVQQRSGYDGQQAADLGERLGGDADCLLHLMAHRATAEVPGGLQSLARCEHLIHDVAPARVGGHPSRRDVGVGEQTLLLEQRKLVADGRRATV